MKEVICALATPPLKSALAIIRVSGSDSFNVVSKIFSKNLSTIKTKNILFGYIKNNDEIIDQVVLLCYVSPHSFTGENAIEIICHGSILIANEIVSLLIGNGARLATRGEFSSRAFLNSKIDLVQAEAINDIINATTKEAKALSMFSLKGETSALIRPIETKIADLLAAIEVNIDYPEYEDIEEVNKKRVVSEIEIINKQIDRLTIEGKQGQLIKEGVNIAILGKPNVGKSSLLNALINEEKAIVTNIPGTTRDVVEGSVVLKGITLNLFDTAGIRESKGVIESIGIEKSKKTLDNADLVILVLDSSEELDKEDKELEKLVVGKKTITVYNKSDLAKERNANNLYTSALNKDVSQLEKQIIQVLGIEEASFNRPSLNNARQIGLLLKIKNALLDAVKAAKEDYTMDIVSSSIQEAYSYIKEILGETYDFDLSEEIFSRFCVGK